MKSINISTNMKNIWQRARRVAKFPNRKFLTGFTIIEIIITVAILSFGILGIYGFLQPASVLTGRLPLNAAAVYLAQEGMEIVKNIRDNNLKSSVGWSNGFNICQTGCQLDYKTKTSVEGFPNQLKAYDDNNFLNTNSDGFYSYDSGISTKFKRKVTIVQPSGGSANVLKVNVLILWNHNNQSLQYETIAYIYNYSNP
jgi:prepilin-type N-terminal cleavage/methylation domain-containing protein